MRSRHSEQDGATAVIVALSMLLLFAAGAAAIDLGAAWMTKRDLAVDTDAAAMAAAQVGATEGCSANAKAAAEQFLSANLGADAVDAPVTLTVPTQYECSTDASGNTVRVTFDEAAQQTLGGAIGASEIDVLASSTAEFNGFLVNGLRPFAACLTDGPVASVLAGGPTPVRYLLSMQKTFKETGCAKYPGGAGSWGFLCFHEDTGCSDGLIRNWIDGNGSGYPGTVDLGTSGPDAFNDNSSDEDCNYIISGDQRLCWARTGSTCCDGVPDKAAINALVGQRFAILVTDCIGQVADMGTPPYADDVCEKGSGGNTQVHPYAFAYVELEAWCPVKNNATNTKWNPAPPPGLTDLDCWNFGEGNGDLVLSLMLFGVSTTGTPAEFFNGEPPEVEMCGVDHDLVAGGDRCDGVFAGP